MPQLLWLSLMDLSYLFMPTSQWGGHLPTMCEFYHRCCDLPLNKAGEGEWLREHEGRGVGRSTAQQARGVISREAVMASLRQNRKHSETRLLRARCTAQSTLTPFSHPHILWVRPLSAPRLLCPHRRCHKKPSMPPISTKPQPFLILRETVEVNLLIVLCDYSFGLLLWVPGRMRDMGCPNSLEKMKNNQQKYSRSLSHKAVSLTVKRTDSGAHHSLWDKTVLLFISMRCHSRRAATEGSSN